MEFFTTDINGVTQINPDAAVRRRVLASVEDSDADYPEVYLSCGGGLSIGYRAGGWMTWEQDGEVVKTQSGVSLGKAGQIWNEAAKGGVGPIGLWDQ